MIYLKNEHEIKKMKIAGKYLAELFSSFAEKIFPGVSLIELDRFAEEFILSKGMRPMCKGYGRPPFPTSTCMSINDVVVHGVPKIGMFLKDGDLLKIDIVVSFEGYCADMARGFLVGNASALAIRLNKVAEDSFLAALSVVKPGNFIHDISMAVQTFVEKEGFYVVREFVGHGIGKSMHEDPQVPNFLTLAPAVKLVAGMTLAIEPMILASKDKVVIDKDGWTARSKSGVWASHYEDTILVTNDGCLVLTSIEN
jgi:methionyl aminopeptidase